MSFASVIASMALSVTLLLQIQNSYGFENFMLKIDGFGRIHRTHANGAPEVSTYIIPLKQSSKPLGVKSMHTLSRTSELLHDWT